MICYSSSISPLFSVITQPWRHPGAILCFHVIIHIFITIHHKLPKFNTHKLQVIGQHIDNPCRHDAYGRARQILTCSKSPMNNFEYEPGHLEHFKIFRPYVSAHACALTARGKVKIQNCCMIWIPLTIIDNFHSFAFTLDLSLGRASASKFKIRGCCYGLKADNCKSCSIFVLLSATSNI